MAYSCLQLLISYLHYIVTTIYTLYVIIGQNCIKLLQFGWRMMNKVEHRNLDKRLSHWDTEPLRGELGQTANQGIWIKRNVSKWLFVPNSQTSCLYKVCPVFRLGLTIYQWMNELVSDLGFAFALMCYVLCLLWLVLRSQCWLSIESSLLESVLLFLVPSIGLMVSPIDRCSKLETILTILSIWTNKIHFCTTFQTL